MMDEESDDELKPYMGDTSQEAESLEDNVSLP